MQNNYYEIYVNQVLALAETVVIKSEYSAQKSNEYLNVVHPASFNPVDPRTWRYYKHVAGEYYVSDTPMYVTSIDTLESILFSKANLAVHRATERAYQYGSRYYNELVAAHPTQEALILGVLYPCELEAAIAAPDHTILAYPKHLIETQESDLLGELQRWVYQFFMRWDNTQYNLTDDLYQAALLAVMYTHLVGAILNTRLKACKTNQVHSYHIRQYLASHGMLDRFMDTMTLKQSLFFYRNIRWFERNSGRDESYRWLVENLMSERRLPLVSFTMGHSESNQVEELTPQIFFKRKTEGRILSTDLAEVADLPTLLAKEDRLAPANPEERVDQAEQIQSLFAHSIANRVQTKMLESSMYDYTDSTPYSMAAILLNHWVGLSTSGIYNAYISLPNPRTGDNIPLTVKEAFIFATYLNCKMIDMELAIVPKALAQRVQRMPNVRAETLFEVSSYAYFDLAFAQDLLKYQPVLDPIVSIDAFYDKCQELYKAANYQRDVVALQEHQFKRGLAHGMISYIYCDRVCELAAEGTTYAEWFLEKGIDLNDFALEDYPDIYKQVVETATGANLNTTGSLKNLQRAMIQMLGELSSYSIQMLASINDDAIKLVDWPVIRLGDSETYLEDNVSLGGAGVEVLALRGTLKDSVTYDTTQAVLITPLDATLDDEADIEIPNLIRCDPFVRNDAYTLRVSKVGVFYRSYSESLIDGVHPIHGIEHFLTLTPEEFEQISQYALAH